MTPSPTSWILSMRRSATTRSAAASARRSPRYRHEAPTSLHPRGARRDFAAELERDLRPELGLQLRETLVEVSDELLVHVGTLTGRARRVKCVSPNGSRGWSEL